MAGGIGFFAFTTEVSPGAGTKVAAREQLDGSWVQLVEVVSGGGADVQNPTPIEEVVTQDEVINDHDLSSVASGTSSAHSYTVPSGKYLEFKGTLGSSTASFLNEISYSLDGSVFVTLAQRNNDRGTLDCDFEPRLVPAGGVARVNRTNRGNLSARVSTTIKGILRDV